MHGHHHLFGDKRVQHFDLWLGIFSAHPSHAGCVLWALALEGTRRAGGTSIFVIALVFSLYPIVADKMPGFLWGTPFTPLETARYHAMGVDSIIGIPIKVAGNILLGFIIFGVALVSTGGSRFFMDLAMSLMGSRGGGAAKVSVLSSSLMASLSGSVISNVLTTGAVTIPAMKKTGYTPTYAAAIEACASTGGTIMPPIMGAAGFLIASFLNVPYVKVIYAAFFPAFLYYFTLLIQVDAHAASKDIQGLKKSEIPSLIETIKSGWFYVGALILLIFFLIYIRIEAWAPFFTILFLFTCAMFRKETRFDVPKSIGFLVETGRLVGQIVWFYYRVGMRKRGQPAPAFRLRHGACQHGRVSGRRRDAAGVRLGIGSSMGWHPGPGDSRVSSGRFPVCLFHRHGRAFRYIP